MWLLLMSLARASFGPWSEAWTADTERWVQAIAVAPTGEVLVASNVDVVVLAGDDGHLLRRLDPCEIVPGGLGFVGDRLVAACEHEVVELTWPGLVERKVASFPRAIELAAIGADRVAVMEDPFWIEAGDPASLIVVATPSGAELDRVELGMLPDGFAFAPEGRLALSIDGLGVQVRDVARHATARSPLSPLRTGAVAVAADGRRAIVDVQGKVLAFDLVTGEVTGQWAPGRDLARAVWVGDGALAAGRGVGLVWLAPGADPVSAPGADDATAFGVSPDGQAVCGGSAGGAVSCFRRGATPAAAPGIAVSGAELDPVEGAVASFNTKVIVVTLPAGTTGRVGQTGTLSVQFSSGGQGNFRFTGWLETARVRVDAIAGATWTLAVLERKGSIQVDGRPIEPLKVAVPVRLKLDPG